MNHFVSDTTPPAIYISLADLPALLSGNIVAITLDQMDTLTVDMIEHDAAKEKIVVYEEKLDTAYMEIYKRDIAIQELTELDDFNKREVKNQNWLIQQQDAYIQQADKDLKKQKRKTGFAWFTTGLGIGLGILLGTQL